MSIKYYAKGEHPTGFIGFRVTVGYAGKYLQKYFKTSGDEFRFQDDRCVFFKRQRLRAELQNAEWEADSAWYQYQKFVSSDHPSTGPHHGVGVHGITLQFKRDRRGKWQAGIEINTPKNARSHKGKRGHFFYTFRTQSFTKVWRRCVNIWADMNEVLKEDRARVLASPPPPQQFKELRRHLNENTAADIPVEALRPVFAEHREHLKAKKGLALAKFKKTPNIAVTAADSEIAEEMAAWFQSSQAS